jgi:hypothetical protein
VVVDRLRRRRPIAIGGTDHLSHRLVARGLSPTTSVVVLWCVSGVLGLIGLLGGQDIVPPAAMLLAWIPSGGMAWFLLMRTAKDLRIQHEQEPEIGSSKERVHSLRVDSNQDDHAVG